MAFIDYYKIMGISKDTPQSDIRKAYVKRAKQFHPDLHPNDPKAKAKFQALNEAYDVLNDPDKRKKYDEYGEHWKEAGAFGGTDGTGGFGGGAGGYSSDSGGFDFSQFNGGGGFSSFFEDLFGHRGARGGGRSFHMNFGGNDDDYEQPDSDKQATVTIDMYTALLGGEIMIQIDGSTYKLKVNPYTQNGTKVRMRGKGYPKGNGMNGDLILTYKVELPKNLTERQKQLLRQMQTA